jgi:hypothetical protein
MATEPPVTLSPQPGPCPLCRADAKILGPNPTDGIFRVTCGSCQTFDIAENVVTWLEDNAEARNMAHLVSATSQREAKADWRLRIETDLDYILIAAEEQSRQAKGDLS